MDFNIRSIGSPTESSALSAESGVSTGGATQIAGKEAFLKLLVAQIKNQNPLNPTDGVQFLTQLAQFSELEQMMGIRADLQSLKPDAARNSAPQAGGAAPPTANAGKL